jgi:hypothetical protein
MIKPRERDTIIQALTAGVVPRLGLKHIQVGRVDELAAMVKDIDRVKDGGSAVRFIVGDYGAGKTFFSTVVRLIAHERKCVTIHADLSTDRRLHGSSGQARALYSAAIANMATRTKPEGGALDGVIERLVTECVREADQQGTPIEGVIERKLEPLRQFNNGYDFATVVKAYWRGSESSDQDLQSCAVRWLRGEYSTKTQANKDLGVRTIIDDDDVYDSLKALAYLVRAAGYDGLMVMFDEMVSLYGLQNAQARKQNYEQVFRIVNDGLQGNTVGIGFVMCGTPEFLMHTRRGLYSHEALQSRLSENTFTASGYVDYSGPVLRLQNLTQADMLILLENIRNVFALEDPAKFLVPDDALQAFMDHCYRKIGARYFETPRSTIRKFVQMLSTLEQNPKATWEGLLEVVPLAADAPETTGGDEFEQQDNADELAGLRLRR